jgi:hypothetical protein
VGNQAGRGKNMHGFYLGFKLHIIVNSNREIVGIEITPANVHDIQALKKDSFVKHVKGILVGDKAYQAAPHSRNILERWIYSS